MNSPTKLGVSTNAYFIEFNTPRTGNALGIETNTTRYHYSES